MEEITQPDLDFNGKPHRGACFCTKKVSFEGMKVGFMYREEPNFELDNGWRIFSGTETQEYVDNAQNARAININTIIDIDPAILPYLDLPIGTELERVEGTDEFKPLD